MRQIQFCQAAEKCSEAVKTMVHPKYRVTLEELCEVGFVKEVLCNRQ